MVLSSFISPLGCNKGLSLQSGSFQKPQKVGRTFGVLLRNSSLFFSISDSSRPIVVLSLWARGGRVRWDVMCVQRVGWDIRKRGFGQKPVLADSWELRLMRRSEEMLTEPGALISRETASARLRMWAERKNAPFPKSLRAPRFGAAAGWALLSPGRAAVPRAAEPEVAAVPRCHLAPVNSAAVCRRFHAAPAVVQ